MVQRLVTAYDCDQCEMLPGGDLVDGLRLVEFVL